MKSLSTYLFISNIDNTLAFYERLGLTTERVSDMFGRASLGDEVILEFGTSALTSSYDPNYVEPPTGSKTTINFELESEQAVDSKYEEMKAAGYVGHLDPIDAMWGARFAVLIDPDGNQIGIHSPRDVEADRERERSE